MSSQAEDIIRETFSSLAKAIGVQIDIPDEMIANLAARLQAQIDLLAELQSTGRLLAAGGMALTAEQVEDVRAAREELRGYRNFTGYGRSHVNQLIAAVDALFPATEPAGPCSRGVRSANNGHEGTCAEASGWAEPAEERRSFPTIQDVPNNTLFHTHGGNGSSLFVRNQSGDLRLCLNAGPEWSKLLRDEDFLPSSGPYVEVPWSKFPQPPADPFAQPAPAEPVEEETKAETCAGIFQGDRAYLCALAAGHYGDHTTANGEHWQKSSSSPVVPAPTETGLWQTWQEVPEGVWYMSRDRVMHNRYVNHSGVRRSNAGLPGLADYAGRIGGFNEAYAPFVAAEEG